MVQLWYPTTADAKGEPARYLPDFDVLRAVLASTFRMHEVKLEAAAVPATEDAPVAGGKPFPVVVFSPGLGQSRHFYTNQVLELASHGYVVAAIDHSYDAEGIVFPGKRLVKRRDAAASEAEKAPSGGKAKATPRLRTWADEGIGVNALTYVGHGHVRREVMGMDDRAPTPEELATMRALVRQGMEEGALGLSTGLFYTPGFYGLDYPPAHPYELVKAAMSDAKRRLVGTGAKGRPFLQASDDYMGRRLKYTADMLLAQVRAAEELGFNEWVYWGGYLKDALRPADGGEPAAAPSSTSTTTGSQ